MHIGIPTSKILHPPPSHLTPSHIIIIPYPSMYHPSIQRAYCTQYLVPSPVVSILPLTLTLAHPPSIPPLPPPPHQPPGRNQKKPKYDPKIRFYNIIETDVIRRTHGLIHEFSFLHTYLSVQLILPLFINLSIHIYIHTAKTILLYQPAFPHPIKDVCNPRFVPRLVSRSDAISSAPPSRIHKQQANKPERKQTKIMITVLTLILLLGR